MLGVEVKTIPCPSCHDTGVAQFGGACALCGGSCRVEPFMMRAPCRWCTTDGALTMDGVRRESNGQDLVYCLACYRWCYNAPKVETGKPQRTLKSRAELKHGQRGRILERDGSRCQQCGKSPMDGVILNAGHVVSVRDCKTFGFEADVYNDDDNLFAQCEECNADQGARSLAPPLLCRILVQRIHHAKIGDRATDGD